MSETSESPETPEVSDVPEPLDAPASHESLGAAEAPVAPGSPDATDAPGSPGATGAPPADEPDATHAPPADEPDAIDARPASEPDVTGGITAGRLSVRKTYKLYVGGAFPRSESGRTYEVTDADGAFLANAALGSRKDARDAVVAARKAFAGWSSATAYNRGQVLYRVAEMLEGRRAQFVDEVAAAEGLRPGDAAAAVDAAIDRWVWYAGWSDKVHQVRGSSNPVAGPYFDFSVPEPTGVVAVVAPSDPLLGLVSVVAPVVVTGNTCVVVANRAAPLPAITLAEVLATSDVPGGVVNLLTGDHAEIAPWLASHMDVNALDLTGVTDPQLAAELERSAADNLKRVVRPPVAGTDGGHGVDWTADPGLDRMTAFLETKTVWHPVGI